MHFNSQRMKTAENAPHIQRSRDTQSNQKNDFLFFSYSFADGQFFDSYVANHDTKNHSTRQRWIHEFIMILLLHKS